MKAYQGQLEKNVEGSKIQPENDNGHKPDSLFAMIRRFQGELKSMQTDIANLKRDVRRHDRQIYSKDPGKHVETQPGELHPAEKFFPGTNIPLFGGL